MEESYFNASENSIPDIRKLLLKIHSQFAHLTKPKLVKLMEDTNVWDDDFDVIANKLYENYDI